MVFEIYHNDLFIGGANSIKEINSIISNKGLEYMELTILDLLFNTAYKTIGYLTDNSEMVVKFNNLVRAYNNQ